MMHTDKHVQDWLNKMPNSTETHIQNLLAADRSRPGRTIVGEMHLVRSRIRDIGRVHVYRVNFLEHSWGGSRPLVHLFLPGHEIMEFSFCCPLDDLGLHDHGDVHLAMASRFFNKAIQLHGEAMAQAERITVEYRDDRPVMVSREPADSWRPTMTRAGRT